MPTTFSPAAGTSHRFDNVVELLAELTPQPVPLVGNVGSGYSALIDRCGDHLFHTSDIPAKDEYPVAVLLGRYVNPGVEEAQLAELTAGQVSAETMHAIPLGELILVNRRDSTTDSRSRALELPPPSMVCGTQPRGGGRSRPVAGPRGVPPPDVPRQPADQNKSRHSPKDMCQNQ